MQRLAWVLVASSITACVLPGAPPEEATGTAQQAIIGGTRSTGTTATVLLASFPANRSLLGTCTAVLVSPTVLLTAAHCVDAEHHPNYLYGVFPDADAAQYNTLAKLEPHLVPVASVHPHPDYNPASPFYADIAVVVLQSPLATPPAPIQRVPLDAAAVGMPAMIVGYGQVVYGTTNQTRYEAATVVKAVSADTVTVGDADRHGCLGDSGGPAFLDGTVIGIDSYGPSGCTGPSHYRRPDAFLPFIDQYVTPPTTGPDAGVDPMGPDAGGDGGGDDSGDDSGDDDGGGCSAAGTGTGTGAGLLLLAALLIVRRARA